MSLLRILNPLVANPTAPRHRTARAVEALARAERARSRSNASDAVAAVNALRAATPGSAEFAAALERLREVNAR